MKESENNEQSLVAQFQQAWRDGRGPRVEDWIGDRSEISDDSDTLLEIIHAEYRLRDDPSVKEELYKRFPQLKDQLERLFAIESLLDETTELGDSEKKLEESKASGNDSKHQPVSIFGFIDSLCRQFQAEWRRGLRPRIEEYLVQVSESARSTLFRNLLNLEIESRRRRNENPISEEYATRFPDSSK